MMNQLIFYGQLLFMSENSWDNNPIYNQSDKYDQTMIYQGYLLQFHAVMGWM